MTVVYILVTLPSTGSRTRVSQEDDRCQYDMKDKTQETASHGHLFTPASSRQPVTTTREKLSFNKLIST
ncbi:unnamed protein product [Allacma fusca]|uniref:Uncharacterized protein n=1 Tax=Allacma fusca TaxID=39272 RepID=A0A8J2PW68_9HEXA|nr:unnamed protein product [Allacma fusca]